MINNEQLTGNAEIDTILKDLLNQQQLAFDHILSGKITVNDFITHCKSLSYTLVFKLHDIQIEQFPDIDRFERDDYEPTPEEEQLEHEMDTALKILHDNKKQLLNILSGKLPSNVIPLFKE